MNNGAHHAHLRKRLYRNLEQSPHPSNLKKNFDYLMYGVGIIAPIALIPQVIDVYTSRDVSGLSLPTWALLAGINFLWVLYGILHREHPIILANTGMTILNLAVAMGILLFR